MHDDNEIRQRILSRSKEMFAQYGYTKVTMEEIAESLGISKKTLYKHFGNKEFIVREIIQCTKCEMRDSITAIIGDKSLQFVDRLKKLLAFIGSQAGKFHGPMIRDIMRNNPSIWEEIKEFRRQNTIENISKLIAEGVEQGIFRKDINQNVITYAYVGAIHTMIVPEIVDQLHVPPEEMFRDIIRMLFEGILSPAGREEYFLQSGLQSSQEVTL